MKGANIRPYSAQTQYLGQCQKLQVQIRITPNILTIRKMDYIPCKFSNIKRRINRYKEVYEIFYRTGLVHPPQLF